MQYLLCLLAASFTAVFAIGDMGEGRWLLLSIGDCDEEDLQSVECKCRVEATRRKHNRTLDVFDLTIDCDDDIDDSYGALVTICQQVDGGCKEWQVLSDDSFPRFGKKYAEENLRRAMEMAKIDPPEFPFAAGSHSITDYCMDYCEFPTSSKYGIFEARGYLLKDQVKIVCLKAVVQFDEDTEGYNCD